MHLNTTRASTVLVFMSNRMIHSLSMTAVLLDYIGHWLVSTPPLMSWIIFWSATGDEACNFPQFFVVLIDKR